MFVKYHYTRLRFRMELSAVPTDNKQLYPTAVPTDNNVVALMARPIKI